MHTFPRRRSPLILWDQRFPPPPPPGSPLRSDGFIKGSGESGEAVPTMASKLKERRVSPRPPCAHGFARPAPAPSPPSPPKSPPPPKAKPQPTHPPSPKNHHPAEAARAAGEPPGGGAERTRSQSILHPSRGRVAPGAAVWGQAAPRRGRDQGVAAPAGAASVCFPPPTPLPLSPLTRPVCFCRERRFPTK